MSFSIRNSGKFVYSGAAAAPKTPIVVEPTDRQTSLNSISPTSVKPGGGNKLSGQYSLSTAADLSSAAALNLPEAVANPNPNIAAKFFACRLAFLNILRI